MTNPVGFDFTKFVPGFDFLKNLTPGAASAATSAAPSWVAPTLDPDELDKRIQELKTVQFWLEQNSKAVGATVQALEVQRMTLNTLRGMNMSFNDLAESLKVKPQETTAADKPKYSFTQAAAEPEVQAEVGESRPAPEAQVEPQPKARKTTRGKKVESGIDPAQWWGAVTEQFQHIATQALNDMSQRANLHASRAAPPPVETAPTKPKASSAKKNQRSADSPSRAKKSSSRGTTRKTTR